MSNEAYVEDQPLSLALLTSSTNVRVQALKTILQRFEDPSKATCSTSSSLADIEKDADPTFLLSTLPLLLETLARHGTLSLQLQNFFKKNLISR